MNGRGKASSQILKRKCLSVHKAAPVGRVVKFEYEKFEYEEFDLLLKTSLSAILTKLASGPSLFLLLRQGGSFIIRTHMLLFYDGLFPILYVVIKSLTLLPTFGRDVIYG